MARPTIDSLGRVLLVLLTGALAARAYGAALDQDGDIKLGVRAYTAAAVGTQDTEIQLIEQAPGRITQRSLTFPVSATGHLRQSRSFVEATLEHNLDRLVQQGFGPLALLNDLPFKLRKRGYFLSYRGEYDGVYDHGPAEYRTAHQYYNRTLVPASPFGSSRTSARPASTCATPRCCAIASSRPTWRPTSAGSSSASGARSWPGARPTSSACSTTSTRSTTASAASWCRSTSGACRSTYADKQRKGRRPPTPLATRPRLRAPTAPPPSCARAGDAGRRA